jgi:tryptophan synthase alpha chain
MAAMSDGAIVGSAIVKIIARYGTGCVPYAGEFVSSLAEAVHAVSK